MIRRRALLLALFCSVLPWPARVTAAPAGAAAEIAYLIAAVESSRCEFARNGRWVDGRQAAAHLREKYQWLTRFGQLDSAEEFIDKVATRSAMSGQPYLLRCRGAVPVEAAPWLRESLGRYRAGATQSEAAHQH